MESRPRSMKQEEGLHRFPSGCTLYRQVFRPEGTPVGGMLMIHGLGDHLHRYGALGRFFAERGILGVGVDFPGHGHSPGQRGHLPGWDPLVELLDDLVLQLRTDLPDHADLGLFGHSFGAFLGIDYLARRPGLFRMAWLSSPLVDPSYRQPALVVRMAGIVGAICPRFPIDTGVRASQCRAGNLPEAEGGGRSEERLLHHRVSAGFASEMLARAPRVRAAATRLPSRLDLLMTHGTEDVVCPPHLSRELFDSMSCARKTYHSIEGALHEPLHGDHRDALWRIAGPWLDGLGFPPVR